MSRRSHTLGAASLALALVLAGCSDSNSPSTTTDLLSATDAQLIGDDVASDVGDLSDESSFDASTGLSFAAAAGGAGQSLMPPLACITVTPQPLVNSDADILPDSMRIDYSQCDFSRAGGNIIDSLTGSIDFLDPLPNAVSIGVRHRFTGFGIKRVVVPFPLRTFSAVSNGIREWGGNADTLGHTISNFTTTITHTATGRQSTHIRDWVGKFTADTAGAIAFGSPLPHGLWTVNGTGSWATGNRSWTVETQTTTPMHYDPTCNVAPRLDGGEVYLIVTRNTQSVGVTITFTACGQYTVTRTVLLPA